LKAPIAHKPRYFLNIWKISVAVDPVTDIQRMREVLTRELRAVSGLLGSSGDVIIV